MATTIPRVGNIMAFRYPDDKIHRFYNAFPHGRRVKPFEAYVDLHGTFVVTDVEIAWKAGVEYISVEFRSHNGTMLWTVYSKGDHELLEYIVLV
jgi:hypothetical protein